MKNYKNYFIILGSFLVISFTFLLLLTLLNYFNIIGYKTVYIISFIFTIILYFISGFYLAKKSDSFGYLSGLLSGFTITFFLIILSLILKANLSWTQTIYYGVLILSSMFGGIIGINYNNKDLKE